MSSKFEAKQNKIFYKKTTYISHEIFIFVPFFSYGRHL